MADLQSALRSRLKANTSIAAVVNEIAWGGIPEKTALPYVRLTKVATEQSWTHSGPDRLVSPWVQIEVMADNLPAVGQIIELVQSEMQRLDEVTFGGWIFLPPARLSSDLWSEPEDVKGGITAYRASQDYQFYAQPA